MHALKTTLQAKVQLLCELPHAKNDKKRLESDSVRLEVNGQCSLDMFY